ncbi:histidine phosphatase family protein [Mesorhizobium sp. CU2]|uniref:histidine phosphatase family protein n=1 Tax=unclassified Mesorhizobium TaxID=325217 RepID=UPI00112A80EF|nr:MULTISPECIES: histidine phosphatase family protein [unclassified Mesorhizobium]TPN83303.1 histidine phosphatase family protein [Mesorhizobium sp. CU3]TPO02925.1 histidine phosphatase family protein [Mesorhizobium sp. CU2]
MYPLVYIARHGQTAWNAEHRLQGQADTDINARGRDQAAHNGRQLAALIGKGADFDFVASPMRRTRETMELMRAAMGLDPLAYRTDPRLVELSFGDWQGHTFAELEERVPGSTDGRRAAKWDFQPPGEGAESYEMLLERVKPWFDALRQPTVCVTHGGVIRCFFRFVAGLSKREAAGLEVPQNRLLRLEGRSLHWL